MFENLLSGGRSVVYAASGGANRYGSLCRKAQILDYQMTETWEEGMYFFSNIF